MHAPQNITAYIKGEPAHARNALTQVRALVRKLVPKATEKLAWGMPTFCLEGNLLHYAAFKSHMSIFPGTDAVRHFKKELGGYHTSKGTIQIPYAEPVPLKLVSRIVKFCVERNRKEAQARAEKKRSSRKVNRGKTATARRTARK